MVEYVSVKIIISKAYLFIAIASIKLLLIEL